METFFWKSNFLKGKIDFFGKFGHFFKEKNVFLGGKFGRFIEKMPFQKGSVPLFSDNTSLAALATTL